MSEQAQQPERQEQVHLVSSAGHPNYGDEFITASWLRFLAKQRPDAEVVLHTPDPGLATYLFDGLHPRVRHTNLLWRVAWDTMEMDADTADAHVDRVVTDLGTPRYDVGLLALRAATTVHLLGGGYVTATWEHHSRLVRAARRLAEVSGSRFVATGLGLIPAIDPARTRADLGACDHATVRDRPSAEMSGVELGVSDAFLGLPDLPAFGARPDPTGRPGDVWINIQGDMAAPGAFDAAVAAVRALVASGRFEGRTLRYVEAIPGSDYRGYEALADLIPAENVLPFLDLWQGGFPGAPLQTWITTRFHFHQLAAAVGAEGIAIEIDEDYYRTKHESLLDVGTGFALARVGAEELPEPASNPDFRLQAGRLHQQKLAEAEALYPRAVVIPARAEPPVPTPAPPRPKGLFGRR